ncbi:MAG TPA: FAD:protein FMN transferase, partial [Burkholderiales bacterium]|nr:FAD:protein FMN transferase [Burkholderiales bacterium]
VAELRHGGALAGLVNAGGDMRAFGPRRFPIALRHPDQPSRTLPWRDLREAALATSASYGPPRGISITVQAPRAMLADALTKVVRSAAAERMLARYRARAWVLCATTA